MPIKLTPEHRSVIQAELDRTGFDVKSLKARTDVPAGLTVRTVKRWMRGWIDEAAPEHVDYMIGLLASLPDHQSLSARDAHKPKSGRRVKPSSGQRIALTPEMTATLEAELKRTGASVTGIARTDDLMIVGLTANLITNWRSGATATANPDLWQFVMTHLSQLPDRAAPPKRQAALQPNRHRAIYRLITEAEFVELQRHRTRTGLTGQAMFKHAVKTPDDLDGNMVAAWLRQQTVSASPPHIAYILRLYASLPDADGKTKVRS